MTTSPLSARVRNAVANGRWTGTVWVHNVGRFQVRLQIEPISGYQYDGDDEKGETQAKLDSGEFVAFESSVIVDLDGEEIGRDDLYGSVYSADQVSEFWTAHRDSDPMNRNCSIMRQARGANVVICHYFPDMVRNAVQAAREHVLTMRPAPFIRAA